MPLNILVTNDDGINVPGLWLLVDALRPLGKVTVTGKRLVQATLLWPEAPSDD